MFASHRTSSFLRPCQKGIFCSLSQNTKPWLSAGGALGVMLVLLTGNVVPACAASHGALLHPQHGENQLPQPLVLHPGLVLGWESSNHCSPERREPPSTDLPSFGRTAARPPAPRPCPPAPSGGSASSALSPVPAAGGAERPKGEHARGRTPLQSSNSTHSCGEKHPRHTEPG